MRQAIIDVVKALNAKDVTKAIELVDANEGIVNALFNEESKSTFINVLCKRNLPEAFLNHVLSKKDLDLDLVGEKGLTSWRAIMRSGNIGVVRALLKAQRDDVVLHGKMLAYSIAVDQLIVHQEALKKFSKDSYASEQIQALENEVLPELLQVSITYAKEKKDSTLIGLLVDTAAIYPVALKTMIAHAEATKDLTLLNALAKEAATNDAFRSALLIYAAQTDKPIILEALRTAKVSTTFLSVNGEKTYFGSLLTEKNSNIHAFQHAISLKITTEWNSEEGKARDQKALKSAKALGEAQVRLSDCHASFHKKQANVTNKHMRETEERQKEASEELTKSGVKVR